MSFWRLLAAQVLLAGTLHANQIYPDPYIDLDNALLDTHPIRAIYASPEITQGGSAVVLVHLKRPVDRMWIEDNRQVQYQLFPYQDPLQRAAVLGWLISSKRFRATLYVQEGLNTWQVPLQFTYIHKPIVTSEIRFHNQAVRQFVREHGFQQESDLDNAVRKAVKGTTYASTITRQKPKIYARFSYAYTDPLTNTQLYITSEFGVLREYYYGERKLRQSYHYGIDIASIHHADIFSIIPGQVVFAGYNGLAGNSVFVDHGLGFYTMYGHASTLRVHEGDRVNTAQPIAKTGSTGAATGDHLHLSGITQGVFVDPTEWYQWEWRNKNLYPVLEKKSQVKLQFTPHLLSWTTDSQGD